MELNITDEDGVVFFRTFYFEVNNTGFSSLIENFVEFFFVDLKRLTLDFFAIKIDRKDTLTTKLSDFTTEKDSFFSFKGDFFCNVCVFFV